jgi:acyl carrier protein
MRVIEELQQSGAEVRVINADITDRAKLAGALKQAPFPVRGIIHAAGILDDGVIVQQTWERFKTVMLPKALGLVNLQALLAGYTLDFLVCYSSAASLVGSAGQANYAAANAFMDSFVHWCRARDLPALAINWGPFASRGMAATLAGRHQERMTDRGVCPIAPQAGITLLRELLPLTCCQIAVLPIDWRLFFEFFDATARVPAVFDALRKGLSQVSHTDNQTQNDVLEELRVADAEQHIGIVERFILDLTARTLRVERDAIDPSLSLNLLGMDSLMAVELRNGIKRGLDFDLPIMKLMEGGSISEISSLVSRQLAVSGLTSILGHQRTEDGIPAAPREWIEGEL